MPQLPQAYLESLDKEKLIEQIRKLEGSRAHAWRGYHQLAKRFDRLVNVLRKCPTPNLTTITELKNQVLKIKAMSDELSQCPVCYGVVCSETAHIGMCGHLVCQPCRLMCGNKCPACRRVF